MDEIKEIAGVIDFPLDDAKIISDIIILGYKRGIPEPILYSNISIFEKYPKLSEQWDELMIKYKKLGLFPNWKIFVD